MELQNIIEKAHNEIIKLEEVYNKDNEELEFFDTFFENNVTYNIEGIKELNICDFILAYLKSHNNSLSLEEIEQNVIFDSDFLEYINSDNYRKYMAICGYIIEEKFVSSLEEIIEEKNKLKRKKLLNTLLKGKESADDLRLVVETLLTEGPINEEKLLSFIKEYEKHEKLFDQMVAVVLAKKIVEEEYEDIYNKVDYVAEILNTNKKPSEKTKAKAAKGYIKHAIKIEALIKEMGTISAYHSKLLSEDKKRKRNCAKEISAYKKLIETLVSGMRKEEITDYKQVISKVPNEEIRLDALKLIHSHNLKYYEQLDSIYEELSKNSALNYKALLQQYGISKNEYCIELIMKNKLDDVKYILEKLSRMNIKDTNTVVKILQTSDKNTVDYIYKLQEKGMIKTDFIVNNLSIFSQDKIEYKNLLFNINYLTNKRINILCLEDSQEVLIMSPKMLINNINILEEYELSFGMNKNNNYNFLTKDNLDKLIDTILELDFENILEKDLDILNYDDIKWKRIRVLTDLNIPVNDQEELEKVLKTEFIIPDEKLDEYILNVVPYNISTKIDSLKAETIEKEDKLHEFSKSKRIYKIAGIPLSKRRIKRNLTKLESIDEEEDKKLLISIISGAILNDEEYYNIQKTIAPKLTR